MNQKNSTSDDWLLITQARIIESINPQIITQITSLPNGKKF